MVILITGTSRGIGKYLAQYYSAIEGNQVFGFSRGDTSIENNNYQHFKTDITSNEKIREVFSHIRKNHGRLDVLINNAAINITPSPFILTPPEIVKELFDVNYFGAVFCCREAIKLMNPNKFGRIVNISSMAAKHEVVGESIYTSSKAALTAFTRVLSKEIYKMGITCNVLAPSAVDTDLLENINKEALKEVMRRNAVHEFGKMEDISNTIDWLISPQSSSVTGQVVYLGGV